MSADTRAKVEAIRARHAAATRGPWKWFGYAKRSRKSGHFYLATTHSGRRYVMDFERSGFRDAQPRFQPFPQRGMVLASELAEYEVSYRDDITGIAAPDAVFIENSWQDVADLLARVAELEARIQAAKAECDCGPRRCAVCAVLSVDGPVSASAASERTEWSVDPKLSDTGGGQ